MEKSILSDCEILVKIRSGQIDLFSLLFMKYHKQIRSYIQKKLFNQDEVDDIVQKTFINCYKAVHLIDGSRPLLPYLYQIAKNELKQFYRQHRSTSTLNENIHADSRDLYHDADLGHELGQMDKLNGDHKQALLLYADGYKYKEIADIIKKPLNTVRTIIRRARLSLKKIPAY